MARVSHEGRSVRERDVRKGGEVEEGSLKFHLGVN
jgi:hypothetical protein